MKLGILLISNFIGGAEKRFCNYFKYMNYRYPDDVFLIINQTLYDLFILNNLCKPSNKIIILSEPTFLGKFFKSRYRFSSVSKFFSLTQQVNLGIKVNRTFKRIDFDVVHGVLNGIRYLAMIKISSPKVCLVSSVVDPELAFMKRKRFMRIIAMCDAIDCLNRNIFDAVINIQKSTKNKCFITPNSFTDYSKYLPSESREMQVVFCARLEHFKNPHLFLDMVEIVNSNLSGLSVKYFVAGTGSLSGEIEERVSGLRSNGVNVEYLGFVKDPSIILCRALVFVQPTNSECHATQSLLEAMGCGCAIVTTSLPGIEKVVPPSVGLTCKLAAHAFADKVAFLLKNYETAVRMGQMARKHVEVHFSVDSFAEYLMKIYNDCFKCKN